MLPSFNFIGITFYPYSLFMIAGAVVCFLLFMLLSFKRHVTDGDGNLFAMEMLVISLGAALPSAMLFDSLFKWTMTGTFKLGGATFYGGLVFAITLFPALLLLRKKSVTPAYERLCDLAPCITLGHCLGRIGCFFGGCCFGSPTDSVFGVVFPQGSLPHQYYGEAIAIHPTQLYEAAMLLALTLIFLFLFKKDAFPLYFIFYGAGRIFIEFFRNDSRGSVGLPLSPAQLISIILIMAGAIILAVKSNRRKKFSM